MTLEDKNKSCFVWTKPWVKLSEIESHVLSHYCDIVESAIYGISGEILTDHPFFWHNYILLIMKFWLMNIDLSKLISRLKNIVNDLAKIIKYALKNSSSRHLCQKGSIFLVGSCIRSNRVSPVMQNRRPKHNILIKCFILYWYDAIGWIHTMITLSTRDNYMHCH